MLPDLNMQSMNVSRSIPLEFLSRPLQCCLVWSWTIAIQIVGIGSLMAQGNLTISDRALEIHRQSYVWDGHNDLPWAIREKGKRDFADIDIRQNQPDLHTDIPKLLKGNVGAQFWSVFVPVDTIKAGTAFQTTVEQIAIVRKLVETYPTFLNWHSPPAMWNGFDRKVRSLR